MPKSLMQHYNLLSIWLSLWLTLAHSGSLWLSLWFSQALIGSQGPCVALHVVNVWPHSLSQPVWRVKFSGQKLCIDCRMWLTLHGVVNVSVNQSVRLTLCWLASMTQSIYVYNTRAKFCCLAFLGSNDGVFRLMLVKSHFLDRNI